jgi:hypothetical protein
MSSLRLGDGDLETPPTAAQSGDPDEQRRGRRTPRRRSAGRPRSGGQTSIKDTAALACAGLGAGSLTVITGLALAGASDAAVGGAAGIGTAAVAALTVYLARR